MSEVMQALMDEHTKEKMQDTAIAFFSNGASFELVRASISPEILTDEELHNLKEKS